ncbi:uncharacterized protein LOC143895889 [Temnothorax americanus]|uniref:uncharacterized protein LOC143895889 n=1 Tax=Temnothorax americanus TaxID=1964332 RepID=UPI004068B370
MREENYVRAGDLILRSPPSHHVIFQVISGRLAQARADLERRKKFVSDIASRTRDENRRSEKDVSAEEFKESVQFAAAMCCERLHMDEHKSSTRFRARPPLKKMLITYIT